MTPSDPAFFNKTSSLNINNLGGPLGANISDFLFTIFGQASFLIY
jgi:S-DNA-T family DNA segregation ATPase FtsK/SpoIIIE